MQPLVNEWTSSLLGDGTEVQDGQWGETGCAKDQPRNTWLTPELLSNNEQPAISFILVMMGALLVVFLGGFVLAALSLGTPYFLGLAGVAIVIGVAVNAVVSKSESRRAEGVYGEAVLYLGDAMGKLDAGLTLVRSALSTAGIDASENEITLSRTWTVAGKLRLKFERAHEGSPGKIKLKTADKALLTTHRRLKGAILDALGVRSPAPPPPVARADILFRQQRERMRNGMGLITGGLLLLVGGFSWLASGPSVLIGMAITAGALILYFFATEISSQGGEKLA